MLKNKITTDQRLHDYLLVCNNSHFIVISKNFHMFDNAIDFMRLIDRKKNLYHGFHFEDNLKIELTYHAETDEMTASLSEIS